MAFLFIGPGWNDYWGFPDSFGLVRERSVRFVCVAVTLCDEPHQAILANFITVGGNLPRRGDSARNAQALWYSEQTWRG